ncbi:MAG: SPFH domain-containing protein [Longimicrobiales bacterium]
MSEFLSVIEWFDDTGTQIVQRIPPEGSGELKLGSVVVVRDNQAAVFFRDGRGLDVLGPGRHLLSTWNIPVLTKVLSLPWGFTSPFRAEVVFVNQKLFTDLAWGTQQPVAFRDAELGLVRLRAFGNYAMRVREPLLFVNRLVGTRGAFTTDEIRDYLRDLILSRLTDFFGEHVRSLFDLPAQYNELSAAMRADLVEPFRSYGIDVEDFFISAITPPEEVQRAIDSRGAIAAVGNLDALLKYQAAQALGAAGDASGRAGAAGSPGVAGSTAGEAMAVGAGAGIGMMLPGMIFETLRSSGGARPVAGLGCPACHSPVGTEARFCSSCGEALVAGERCGSCGKRLAADAKFCADCGTPVGAARVECPDCRVELPEGAHFCPSCGKRIET